MAELKFKERVNLIQGELNAPKHLYNSFGKYSYRSAEGTLEAVKPLLQKYKVILTIGDEIITKGEGENLRVYVESTATLHDVLSNEFIYTKALAREELSKKGMDASQVTGSTSSYARKYALNGLLAIDDTKDADGTNTHEDIPAESVAPSAKPATNGAKATHPTGTGLKEVIDEITKTCRELAKTKKKEMTALLVEQINTVDYKTIKDVEVAKGVLEKLNELKG